MDSNFHFPAKIKEKINEECSKIKKEIEIEINKSRNIGDFCRKYGVLNFNWYQSFMKFLNKKININPKNKKFDFNFQKLIPKNEIIDPFYSYESPISFPSNFAFVTENFMNLISEKFSFKEQSFVNNYVYNVEIGGNCLIMKDLKKNSFYRYLILNEDKKDFNNVNIDFILMINDKNEMTKICDIILKNSIWNYLKNIGFTIYEKFKVIYNKYNKPIGYISCISDINRKINVRNKNICQTDIFPKFNSILLSLFLFKDEFNELSKYSNDKNQIVKIFCEFFQNFQKIQILENKFKSIFSNSIKSDSFQSILSEIYEKVDSEISFANNRLDISNEVDYSDEYTMFENIKELYMNSSIVQKLFFCVKETKKYCQQCRKLVYKFKLSKMIILKSIDETNGNFLFEKLFAQKEKVKNEKCKFCKKKIPLSNSKKIISLPKILVIICENAQNGKLNLKNNFRLNNNEDIEYELKCFIEEKTNRLYYKRDDGLWYKYNEDSNEKYIENKIPIVLFFSLIKSNKKIINNYQNNIWNNYSTNKKNITEEDHMDLSKSNNNVINFGFNNNTINNERKNMNNTNINANMNNNMHFLNYNTSSINNYVNFMDNNMNNMNNKMSIINKDYNNICNTNNNMNIINNFAYNYSNYANNSINNNVNNITNNNSCNYNLNYSRNNYMNMNYNMYNMNTNINTMNNMFNKINNEIYMNNKNNYKMNNNLNYINTNISNINTNINTINDMNYMNNINNSNINFINNTDNSIKNNDMNNSEENLICIIFSFEEYNKQIFIDVNENLEFREVIELLEDKYIWLKYIKERAYIFKKKEITKEQMNYSVKKLGICYNDCISIKANDC